MKCKICRASIGLWGGLNGSTKTYWKHQVSRKVRPKHKPVPAPIEDKGRFNVIDEAVATVQKAASDFQIVEHDGALGDEAVKALDDFELFVIKRLAALADTPIEDKGESLNARCRRVWVCKHCGNCLDHCTHQEDDETDDSNFHEDLSMPCSVLLATPVSTTEEKK